MPASARMARCGAGGSGSASTSGRTGAEAAAAALPLAVRGRRMSLSSSSSLLLPRSSSSSSGIKRRFACRATGDDAQNERIKTTLADLDALLGIQEEPKAADKVRRLCTHQTPPIRGSSMSTYRGADACMLQGLGGGAALHKTPRRARRAAAVAHAVRCALRAARCAPRAARAVLSLPHNARNRSTSPTTTPSDRHLKHHTGRTWPPPTRPPPPRGRCRPRRCRPRSPRRCSASSPRRARRAAPSLRASSRSRWCGRGGGRAGRMLVWRVVYGAMALHMADCCGCCRCWHAFDVLVVPNTVCAKHAFLPLPSHPHLCNDNNDKPSANNNNDSKRSSSAPRRSPTSSPGRRPAAAPPRPAAAPTARSRRCGASSRSSSTRSSRASRASTRPTCSGCASRACLVL